MTAPPAPVEVQFSTAYVLPVTHITVEMVGTAVRMTMAMQQSRCKSVGLSALTTLEVCKLLPVIRDRMVETSPTVKAASEKTLPTIPIVDFDYEHLILPVFAINTQAYAIEERGAVFVDFTSADPTAQLKAQAVGGGPIRIEAARVAMEATMFLAWIGVIEKVVR